MRLESREVRQDSPLFVGTSAPTLADGTKVGSKWSDTSTNLDKFCTSISPVTWAAVQGLGVPGSHVLATASGLGSEHTISGASAGQVLRASSSTAANFQSLGHGDLTGVTATQHHSNVNDPSSDEKAALVGTSGIPSTSNKYVTDADSRNSNARTPTAHASTHVPGGSDILQLSVTDRILGRQSVGGGNIEEITCTNAGRALIDDVDAAAQRTTLGLGTLATKNTIATNDIDNDAVTYAKMQNVSAASRLVGRGSAAGAGDPEEITLGTTLSMSGTALSASTNIKQTEVDFGATPVADGTFTVTDADVLATSQLLAQVAYEAPTGKDLDEIEMDNLMIRCQPAAGSFTMFINTADNSYLADKFKVNYLIG